MIVQRLFLFLASAAMLILIACSSKLDTVEKKDENGVLLERYTRLKTNFAKEGLYESFYPSGKLYEQSTYHNDTLTGERKLFHENGNLLIVEHHEQGRFEGAYKVYYENGQLELEGMYVDNKMTGPWKRYYPSGQLMEIVEFSDNQENGPFIEYHENGNLKAEGAYLDGDHEHGLLKLYDENGQLERKMNCDRGICRTIWTAEEGDVKKETD
jgi:antitoxin component YwqK of YwqJK toxin-antitoxin module